MRTNL
jgi:hypothetical protein